MVSNASFDNPTSNKLGWAYPVAHGSVILALLGLVGNVENPDQALRALLVPLSTLGLGLSLGLWAVAELSLIEALHTVRWTLLDKLKLATDVVGKSSDLFEMPVSMELLHILDSTPGAAESQVRQMFQERAAQTQRNFQTAEVLAEEANHGLTENQQDLEKSLHRCWIAQTASGACAGVALAWFVFAPWCGWSLQL